MAIQSLNRLVWNKSWMIINIKFIKKFKRFHLQINSFEVFKI